MALISTKFLVVSMVNTAPESQTKHLHYYTLVLGLYSKILDSKTPVDFYMAEYSLEITLKDKSQTRLDPNSMVKFRVMPEFTRVLSTLFSICRYVLIFIKSYIYFRNGHISTVRQFTSDAAGFCMSVESMYILHMYVSVVFLEADNNV